MLVDLVEDIVTEQFDDVSVARFRPAGVASELGSFVDEAELAEETDESAVLQFTHELSFETIDRAVSSLAPRYNEEALQTNFNDSSSSTSICPFIISNSWRIF
jgi:hypothetical protein